MKKTILTLGILITITTLSFGQANYYDVNAGNDYGLRFYNGSDLYKIHFGSGTNFTYGPVKPGNYAIKTNMSSHTDRGWTWGVLNTPPVIAMNTMGDMQIKRNFISEGDVAIGTTTLWGKLTVQRSGSGTLGSVFDENNNHNTYIRPGNAAANVVMDYGNVGIGTATPTEKLDVEGNIIVGLSTTTGDGEGGKISFRRHVDGSQGPVQNNPDKMCAISVNSQYGNQENFMFYNPSGGGTFTWKNGRPENGGEVMRISQYGEVGIGTNNLAGYKLSVAGKMRAQEIEVSLHSTWSDFVFADDYKLISLEEVEKYIAKNNHLPDVPSAEEVKKEGINLGSMDAILLQKIEELTLYMIALKKENKELRLLVERK